MLNACMEWNISVVLTNFLFVLCERLAILNIESQKPEGLGVVGSENFVRSLYL